MPKRLMEVTTRITRTYRTGWRHLDHHVDVCLAKTTNPTRHSIEGDDGSWNEKLLVVISPEQRKQARQIYRQYGRGEGYTFRQFMENAISGEFATGCRCEHDCCGHIQSYGMAHQIKPGEFAVTVTFYPNI